MTRPDLNNAQLLWLMAGAALAISAWFVLRRWLPAAWSEPGSPPLYLAGVAGALLLLVPGAFAIAKRNRSAAQPIHWFNAHVWCATLGAVLIAVHSAGYVRRAPAILIVAIIVLAVLGVWARVGGARRIAAVFAARVPFPAPLDAAGRERVRALISAKRRLLGELDPQAHEGTFSVTLHHLLRRPGAALRYLRLAREEAVLLGTRRSAGFALAWWRPLHLAIAWLFMLGVLVHVVTVTLFAGYVADYGPVTWWHLRAW